MNPATTNPTLLIARTRTRLLIDYPWFGSLAMRLKISPDATIETFATDGTQLLYNTEFARTLTEPELLGVFAHEVLHCALLHPFRRGSRDHKGWNEAADYAINGILQDAGITLPKGCLLDSQYSGMSAEKIYSRRQSQPQPQPGADKPQPCPTGTVEDAPKPQPQQQPQPGAGKPTPQPQPADGPLTETDWQIAAEQANRVAAKAGKLPGSAERAINQTHESAEDWRATLREYIEHTTPSDYSWTSPNRRYVAAGIYLPGVIKENLGEIVIAIDTSGSIRQDLLETFATEISALIAESRPELTHVVYCDREIHRTEQFLPDDEITLQASGGGGTAFAPVFDWITEQQIQPKVLLYFTDLRCYRYPESEPDFPTIWVTPLDCEISPPFGSSLPIDSH